jgi:hypothetical protein
VLAQPKSTGKAALAAEPIGLETKALASQIPSRDRIILFHGYYYILTKCMGWYYCILTDGFLRRLPV